MPTRPRCSIDWPTSSRLDRRRHDGMTLMLRDLLYEENSFGVFLLVTVVLGGCAAWLAGRAVARAGRAGWLGVRYAILVCAAEPWLAGGVLRHPDRRRGAVHPFLVVRCDVPVAALLCGRHRNRACLRICRFPGHAPAPDGAAIRFHAPDRNRIPGVNIAGSQR